MVFPYTVDMDPYCEKVEKINYFWLRTVFCQSWPPTHVNCVIMHKFFLKFSWQIS